MSVNAFKKRQLTKEDINIFFNSDEENLESDVDTDSDEDLPPNLEDIENAEGEETSSSTPVHSDSRPVNEVNSSAWKVTNRFNPPGPGIDFEDQRCGVQNPPESPSEVTCFKIFFTEEVMGEIVVETNRYASDLQEGEMKGKMAKWVPTNIKEMYTFLVSVLLMGVIKKPSLRDYWSTDPMLRSPFFGSLFSQDRFLLLLRCLHFANNETAHNDPLKKIRRIFTALISSFRRTFVPYRDLCVDESLMKWKGRLAFRQFIPAKRHRFGVKFFVLCDVLTGYVQDMIIYTGSTTNIQHYEGLGISGSVVMTLLAPYLGKGHVIYMDNWYNSPTLFQHLLSLGTGACGTVRANRKGMPTFTCKMTKGQTEYKENGTQLAVKWHDKRDVHFLTTVHPAGMAATGKVDHSTGQTKMKPICVLEYNKKMGAVDKADMISGFHECARKTTKWYKKVFFHLLDTAVLNSHIVHQQLTGKNFHKSSMKT